MGKTVVELGESIVGLREGVELQIANDVEVHKIVVHPGMDYTIGAKFGNEITGILEKVIHACCEGDNDCLLIRQEGSEETHAVSIHDIEVMHCRF